MTGAQLIKAALHGGRRMTASEIAEATGLTWGYVAKMLAKRPEFAPVGERQVIMGRRGGNKAVVLWAVAGPGVVALPQRPSQLGPEGPGRGEIRDSEGVDGAHDYGGGRSSITFVASPEETDCPTIGRVALAACIDGYVTDTARRKGPCDSCAIGRARRAAWAGADFEDELEADDSDSLDLR